jgi:hypothetical protein
MDPMKNLIKEYLSRPTDYAILISGEWGTGKTHYFQNTLKPFIENEIQAIDSPKNYKVVYVSMFGLSSIEDIQKELFVSLLPLLKNKVIRISGGLGKIIARGVLEFKNLGDIDKYIKDVKKISLTVLELNSVVLCFDDLERLNPKLKFDEFIGYVNSIVDSNQGKVVLISNEDKIKNAKKKFKEKVIGLNIEFNPNNRETVQSIIRSNYEHRQQVFYKFINEYLDLVTDFAERIDLNYRTLNFALEKLLTIHSLWLAPMSEEDKQNDPGLSKKIDFVIRFVLGLSHEFRLNRISLKKREDLEPQVIDPSIWARIDRSKMQIAKDEVEITKSYKDRFINKYLEKGQIKYTFINSLYEYITGGIELQVEDFVKKLNFTFYSESQVKKREYELVNIFFNQPYKFSDEEYKKGISEILQCARDKKYLVTDYPLVYLFILRFGNILNVNPGELMEEFKGLMAESDDGLSQQNEMPDIQLPSDSEYGNELAVLDQHAKEILRKRRVDLAESDQKIVAESFIIDDWKSFKAQYDKSTTWQHAPLFHHSKPAKFVKRIKELTNKEMNDFLLMIQNRYRDGYWGDFIEEYAFVKEVALEMKGQYKIGNAFSDYLLSNIHKIYLEASENLKMGYEKKYPSK